MPEEEEWGQCRSTGWWCQGKYKESRKGEDVSLRGHQKFGGEINNLDNGMGGAGRGRYMENGAGERPATS